MKRESGCPLCGAKVSATEWLDACDELIDAELGVLSVRCPHCQGRLELAPAAGRVELGYIAGGAGGTQPRFDVALSIPSEGLTVERLEAPPGLRLALAGHEWEFNDV